MIKRGGGKIINVSSQGCAIGLPLRAAYCSGKGGVKVHKKSIKLSTKREKNQFM
jgi:short-subunit dehydrogenase